MPDARRRLETYTPNPISPDKNLTVCVLASGSRGNSIFISTGSTSLLIDAGLSGVEIERRLAACGQSAEALDAIIVSHEHNDHVQGAGVLARRYALPVYISQRTCNAAQSRLGKLSNLCFFECGQGFYLGDLKIHPFSISHDAEDPAGFTFEYGAAKIGLATDLGVPTAVVREHLKDSRLLILEANHDPAMLLEGSYPWAVKQRIKSRIGHLSNPDSRDLLSAVLHDGLQHVVLAHLSHENNTPEKAIAMVGQALNNHQATLSVAVQEQCSQLLYV